MRHLIGYEIKKLLKRTSTWAVFIAMFGVQAFIGFSGYIGDFMYGDTPGVEQAAAEKIVGRTLDESLVAEVAEVEAEIAELGEGFWKSDVYKTQILPYMDLRAKLFYGGVGADATGDIYRLRENLQSALFDSYGLTDSEKAHWEKQEADVEKPFVYAYAGTWEALSSMNGVYMTSMLITFFIAVCMVGVFTEESAKKTDQLLLCARYGREPLYGAKLIAGSVVVLAASVLIEGVYLLGHFLYYGASGFDESIQMALAFIFPHALSVGGTCLIMVGILFLSSLLIGLIAMLLAQLLHHSLGAMAILIGGVFAARLIPVPQDWRVLSMLWNLIPINMLKVDQGFLELRLYGGLTGYQFAPLVYLVLAVVCVVSGRRLWCRMQIGG
ncbi:MAG: ABC transporter permease subunit [Roseburia sp.]|nr:ABC transporter permease subunit [Roseburia sp.]